MGEDRKEEWGKGWNEKGKGESGKWRKDVEGGVRGGEKKFR